MKELNSSYINRTGLYLIILGMLFANVVMAEGDSKKDSLNVDSYKRYSALFKPLPFLAESSRNPVTKAKVLLGKKLFFEKKLSKGNTISCNSCHGLETYGVDGKQVSTGHNGQKGERNSPTVFNAALHFRQFWDGRAADVEEQASGPVLNPVEMAMSEGEVVSRLSKTKEYPVLFKTAFPGQPNPVTLENVAKAIAAFERKLITPSRFDSYLKGDKAALTQAELKGMKRFVEVGCISCHNGALVGGRMYQKLGAVEAYPTKDLGRFKVSKSEADKYVFKVPSLRNVEKTAPYLHDGSVKTLPEAIRIMGRYQLGKKLNKEEVNEIQDFLKSLTASEIKIP